MNDNKAPKLDPVTVGELRKAGQKLLLFCKHPYCSANEIVDLNKFPFKDTDAVPDLGRLYRNIHCERCGHKEFEARPVYPKARGSI